jgi:hypothetical protein
VRIIVNSNIYVCFVCLFSRAYINTDFGLMGEHANELCELNYYSLTNLPMLRVERGWAGTMARGGSERNLKLPICTLLFVGGRLVECELRGSKVGRLSNSVHQANGVVRSVIMVISTGDQDNKQFISEIMIRHLRSMTKKELEIN